MNADASQFCISGAGTKRDEVKYISELDEDGKILKAHHKVMPEKGANRELTAFFIKWMALVSASGHVGTPVYIIADPDMPADEIDYYEVDGLGYQPGSSGKYQAWLVFSQTRCPPPQFYKWYIMVVVVAFVIDQRNRFAAEDEKEKAWLTLDGEAVQIEPLLHDEEVEAKCKEEAIVAGKHARSLTEKAQALDCKNVFKGIKTKLDSTDITSLDVSQDGDLCGIRMKIQAACDAHKKKTKSKRMPCARRIIGGLLKIRHATDLVLKPKLITESFEKCGLWSVKARGPDIDQIMRQCNVRYTPALKAAVWKALPDLSHILDEWGQILERDLDKYPEFPRSPGTPPDQLCISRKRFVFLLNPKIIDEERTKREVKNTQKEQLAARKAARQAKNVAGGAGVKSKVLSRKRSAEPTTQPQSDKLKRLKSMSAVRKQYGF